MPEPARLIPSWLGELATKLATDADFRREFERTPGRAASSLGISSVELSGFLAGFPEDDELTVTSLLERWCRSRGSG